MRCFNSPSRAECPAAVIGILVIEFCSMDELIQDTLMPGSRLR
jgi:hypothetical protein